MLLASLMSLAASQLDLIAKYHELSLSQKEALEDSADETRQCHDLYHELDGIDLQDEMQFDIAGGSFTVSFDECGNISGIVKE